MLALIFVAILFGVGVVLTGEPGKPFAALLQSLPPYYFASSGS